MDRDDNQSLCAATPLSDKTNLPDNPMARLVLLSVLGCVSAVPTFLGLWKLWHSNKDFNGLILVPGFVVFALLRRKRDFGSIAPRPMKWLLYLYPICLAFMIIMVLMGFPRISGLAFVVSVFVGCFGCLGVCVGRKALGPLLLFFLMIPLPDRVVGMLTTCLQDFFCFVLEGLMPLLVDYEWVRCDSFTFLFPTIEYAWVVAPECSGFRSLLGFLVMACMFAISVKRRRSVYLLIIGAGVMAALFLNLARIIVTIQLQIHGYRQFTEGRWHGRMGIVIFLIGCVFLYAVSRGLGDSRLNDEEG